MRCFLLIFLLLTGFLCPDEGKAQSFYVCDNYGNVGKVSLNGGCAATFLPKCVDVRPFSIAIYKDTLYSIDALSSSIRRSKIVNDSVTNCTRLGASIYYNALTVDSSGTLYAVDGSFLYKIDRHTGSSTFLGIIPYSSGGDLVFYKGDLYLAARSPNAGIIKVNIASPAQSTMYIPMPNTLVVGLVALPVDCNTNKVYAMNGAFSGSTLLIELDMELRTVVGNVCTLPFSVYDAASSVETGQRSGINIQRIQVSPPCTNRPASGSLQITTAITNNITYTINNTVSNNTGLFTGLGAGTYAIHISAASGCTQDTVVTVALADTPTLQIQVTDAYCSGNNGGIISVASGTPAPYLYSLNNGATQVSGSFANIGQGTYWLRATDNNRCVSAAVVTVNSVNPQISPVVSSTSSVCGQQNATISVSVPNAVGYSLNNGAQQASGLFPNLAAGTYTVSVFTNQGCRKDTTIQVAAVYPAIQPTITVTSAICNQQNAGIQVSAPNASGYSLNNGPQQVAGSFSNLAAGTYILSVFTSAGCRKDTTISIASVYPPIQQSIAVTAATCNQSNGRINVTAVAATGYSLNSGVQQPSGLFPNLAAGTYLLSVFTTQGCRYDSVIVINLNDHPIAQTISVQPAFCGVSNGRISITAPHADMHSLNNGVPQTAGLFTNLAPGSYLVSSFNVYGCRKDTNLILPALVHPAPAVSITAAPPDCHDRNNGSFSLAINGAFAPYTVSLDGGAFTSQLLFSNLAARSFSLRVKDAGGCATDTVAVVPAYTIHKPAHTFETVLPTCFNPQAGAIRLSVSGSAPPYQLLYQNRSYTSSYYFQGLTAGNYLFRIADTRNCLLDSVWVPLQQVWSNGCDTLHVPTAFTPDGDGRNDLFKATAYGTLLQYRLAVYNRFGQTVFSTTDIRRAWDGRLNGVLQAAGSFVWMVQYTFQGRPQQQLQGTVLLIR